MPNKVKVHVEYCCSCLSTRYLELNLKILKECDKELLKNLKIDGKVGRRYTFEVTINDELVFSKLKTGAFPDFDAIIEQIVRAYKGKEIKEITKFENLDPVCKLL